MKTIAIIALGTATIALAPAPGLAQSHEYCMDQAQETCGQFAAPGSANWAHCVETLYDICMNGVGTAPRFEAHGFIDRYSRKIG